MTVMYTIFNSETQGSGATLIFGDGSVETVDSSNANYAAIINTLTSTPADEIDENNLRALVAPGASISRSLQRYSDRITFNGSEILFDGDVIRNSVVDHIFRILDEGGSPDSYRGLVAFLEKLYTNPSGQSVDALYEFITRHGLTIDVDGDFYAYKGVNADGTSRWAGYGIVNNQVFENSNLPNTLGAVVEIPRSKVDADNSVGCSTGLHAGSYAYASAYARGRLLTVKINPRDVVAVPEHASFQKLRVSRYKVVGLAEHQIATTHYSAGTDTVDRNNITTLESLLTTVDEVLVSFTYTRGNGDEVTVDDFAVTEVRMNGTDLILIGADENDEVSSYLYANLTNLVIDQDILDDVYGGEDEWDEADEQDDADEADEDTTATVLPDFVAVQAPTQVPVQAPTVEEALRAEIANGNTVVLNFNYTTVAGEPRTLTNFQAEEIRNNGDLLVGIREDDGETRTYRIDRMTDITIVSAGDEDEVEAETEDETEVDDNSNVLEELRTLLNQDMVVEVDFDYTTARGEARTVNLEADYIRASHRHAGKEILVGIRTSDQKERPYRTDRISNLTIVEVL